jgi:ParB-like chromosome segregation protein Spo0J
MATNEIKTYVVEYLAPDALIPYENNSRKHSEMQLEKIVSSIKEFGFNNPVLIDNENGIIAGHGRVEAAKRVGFDKVPCIRLNHLNDAQRRAYVIADNRLTEIGGGWDEDLLREELRAIKEEGKIALNLTGFTEEYLNELLREASESESRTNASDEERGPRVTDDQYADFSLVCQHTTKLLVVSTLNEIKASQNFQKMEDALVFLCEFYNSNKE